MSQKRTLHALRAALTLALACAGLPAGAAQVAVVATVAADYTSAAHSLVTVDPVGGPRTARNNLLATGISDITVAAHGEHFYRIERFMGDNVAKFHVDAPETVIWQFSSNGTGETASNPGDLVFADESQAYLLRYGADTAWIVDPSTTDEAGFKTGELDLSAYADADGLPEMAAAALVGDKLFVVLQRIDSTNNWTPGIAYVAVFDTTTTPIVEIETNTEAGDGLKGIPLPVKNPTAIQYQADTHTLYVQGVGRYAAPWSGTLAEYDGGIASLDPDTYQTEMILDDGDAADHPYGNIAGMAIVSANKGYFVGYAGWGDNTLYSLDLSTGTPTAIDGLSGKSIAGMEGGAYPDQNSMLWVCNATDNRIEILNTATDIVDESVSTGLNPFKVVFTGGSGVVATADEGGGSSGGLCFVANLAGSGVPGLGVGLVGLMVSALAAVGARVRRGR